MSRYMAHCANQFQKMANQFSNSQQPTANQALECKFCQSILGNAGPHADHEKSCPQRPERIKAKLACTCKKCKKVFKRPQGTIIHERNCNK